MEIENINDDNRMELTLDYSNVHYEVNQRIEEGKKEKLHQLFQPIEAKNLVYSNLKKMLTHLLNQQEQQLSYQELATIQVLQNCSVGNLSAMTLLVNLIKDIWDLAKQEDMDQTVVTKILQGLKGLEEKIKNRPTMDQADLYGNISTLLQASPELINISCELLHTLSNKGLKDF